MTNRKMIMTNLVFLPVSLALHQRFLQIQQQFQQGSTEKLSQPLGLMLADLSAEVLGRMFVDLLAKAKMQVSTVEEKTTLAESEKVVQQVIETFKKYMPYAVSFFSNDRLQPLVDYLIGNFVQGDQQAYLTFPIETDLVEDFYEQSNILMQQTESREAIIDGFNDVIALIDAGVEHLILEPKQRLKFNFVIDKTLQGVLNLTTTVGYKRLEKLAQQVKQPIALLYVTHFIAFFSAKMD